MDVPIGERLRQLRYEQTPKLTQRELAERAGVSVDLVAKLEQGRKQSASLVSLHRLARALDVDVVELLARPPRLQVPTEDDGGVLAIRQAITDLWADGEPVSGAELDQQARYGWAAFSTNRFDVLTGMLPGFIGQARATARATPGPGVFGALADAYSVAASMLAMLGHTDLGYLAMTRALEAGDRADDELFRAALSGRMSWLLLHQTGGTEQARRLAVQEADRYEPRLGSASAQQLQVWAGLLVSGAVAAARNDQGSEADDLLNLAETAATRLPTVERAGRSTRTRPVSAARNEIVSGLAPVVMQQVDAAVVTGRPGRALDLAKRIPADAGLPLISRARHMADVAYAQTSLGRDRDATETLLTVEREAPHWMRYQRYPRTIVRELLERERRARTPQLRGLASRLNVA